MLILKELIIIAAFCVIIIVLSIILTSPLQAIQEITAVLSGSK